MSILKAACVGIAGTFLALQFQNSRKEYGIYLGIAVSIFLFLGMSQNLSVIRETLELVGSFVKIDAIYLTAMLKILGVTYLAEFAAAICKDAGYQTIAGQVHKSEKNVSVRLTRLRKQLRQYLIQEGIL